MNAIVTGPALPLPSHSTPRPPQPAPGARIGATLLALTIPTALILLTLLTTLPAHAGGITFHDIAAGDQAGITYRRVPSKTNAIYERITREPLYTMQLVVATPEKPRGAPGVALLDFDGDGDLDIYVTNGPGAANSLYSNRLLETGRLVFEDVGTAAGVAASEQDSTGVCYGDLDNDGDPDLLVLGRSEPNRLFENGSADRAATGVTTGPGGDGTTFRDATAGSGLGEDDLGHTSCSLGDVNGDGLLDVAIANSYDWTYRAAIMSEPFALNHPNQLYLNQGNLTFRDVSESSGIRKLAGFVPPQEGEVATITWGIALVDYDRDGDLDIIHTDDQGAIPSKKVSRGMIQVLANDGTGHFRAVTHEVGTDPPGSLWMGLSVADFNCDGNLDVFGTNMGDYAFSAIGLPFERGTLSSRWFLGRPDGTFEPAELGDLTASVFGWGVVTPDYDNDGDPDVAFYGSLNGTMNTITADNPGTILVNRGCNAAFDTAFDTDFEALGAIDHARRNVHGVATGDLNLDGFPDLVSVSALNIPESVPLKPYPAEHGSPFDRRARYVEVFSPAGNGTFVWNGYEFDNGTLSVEINSADNGNGWIEVRTLGTAGLLPNGKVNRDGIGALVRVIPEVEATGPVPAKMRTAARPVPAKVRIEPARPVPANIRIEAAGPVPAEVRAERATFPPRKSPETPRPALASVTAGASYASESSLALLFGLGKAHTATVEIQWPGGVRNRLEGVKSGERILLPEIPCGIDATWPSIDAYNRCVDTALDRLREGGHIDAKTARRLRTSAFRAYRQTHTETVRSP